MTGLFMNGNYPYAMNLLDNDAMLALTHDMEEYLSSRGDIYEKDKGQNNRLHVIDKLTKIMVEWAGTIGKAKDIETSICENGGGIHLRIFGSTRLGVHTPDADIDVLCVAPSFVDRSDFFGSFCMNMRNRVDVSMLSAVPEAYTPVVKFNIDGQAVDMIFVSLTMLSIPSDLDILDSRHLHGLNEQGIRSLNGSRVAEWICRLVPNFPVFATALRFVKHWARQRGLYSNVLGFLGGVNYAILVAFVCQKYPHVSAGTIVHKFFQTFYQWQWPQPVMLVPVVEDNDPESDHVYLPVWNPKVYPKDGLQLMPIITPAYPAMNSSYNVGYPQYRLIHSEIVRGLQMFQAHHKENPTSNPSTNAFPWRTLCTPAVTDFFSRHPIYIQVDISAYSADDHRSWFGWCESRLRLLILSLEQPPTTFCHPQANCFHRRLQLPNRAPQPISSLGVISSPGGSSGLASSGIVRRSLSDGDLADRQMGHGHGQGPGLSSHNHHQRPNNYNTNQGGGSSSSQMLSSRPVPMFQSNINMSDASTSTSTSPSISPNNIADPTAADDEADLVTLAVAQEDPYVETTTSGSGSDVDICCSSSDGTSTKASTNTNTNTEDTQPSRQRHPTTAAAAAASDVHTQSSTSTESKHSGGSSSSGGTSDGGSRSSDSTAAPSSSNTTTSSNSIGTNAALLSPSSSSSKAGANGSYVTVAVGHVSTFFIGLSFVNGLRGPINVTYAINDFIHRVQCWDGRTSSMGIEVTLRRQSEVPEFVYETKAEPSSMHACTPAKTNKNVGGDEVEIGECHDVVMRRGGGGGRDENVSGVNAIGGDDDCDRSCYLEDAINNSTTVSTRVGSGNGGGSLAEDLASDDRGDVRGQGLGRSAPSTGRRLENTFDDIAALDDHSTLTTATTAAPAAGTATGGDLSSSAYPQSGNQPSMVMGELSEGLSLPLPPHPSASNTTVNISSNNNNSHNNNSHSHSHSHNKNNNHHNNHHHNNMPAGSVVGPGQERPLGDGGEPSRDGGEDVPSSMGAMSNNNNNNSNNHHNHNNNNNNHNHNHNNLFLLNNHNNNNNTPFQYGGMGAGGVGNPSFHSRPPLSSSSSPPIAYGFAPFVPLPVQQLQQHHLMGLPSFENNHHHNNSGPGHVPSINNRGDNPSTSPSLVDITSGGNSYDENDMLGWPGCGSSTDGTEGSTGGYGPPHGLNGGGGHPHQGGQQGARHLHHPHHHNPVPMHPHQHPHHHGNSLSSSHIYGVQGVLHRPQSHRGGHVNGASHTTHASLDNNNNRGGNGSRSGSGGGRDGPSPPLANNPNGAWHVPSSHHQYPYNNNGNSNGMMGRSRQQNSHRDNNNNHSSINNHNNNHAPHPNQMYPNNAHARYNQNNNQHTSSASNSSTVGQQPQQPQPQQQGHGLTSGQLPTHQPSSGLPSGGYAAAVATGSGGPFQRLQQGPGTAPKRSSSSGPSSYSSASNSGNGSTNLTSSQRHGSTSSANGLTKQGFGQGSNDMSSKQSQSQSHRHSHLVNATNPKQGGVGSSASADSHVNGGIRPSHHQLPPHSHRSSSSSASPPRSSSSSSSSRGRQPSHTDASGTHCPGINIDVMGHRRSGNGSTETAIVFSDNSTSTSTSTSPSTITSTTLPVTTKPTKPTTTSSTTTATAVVVTQKKQKRKEQNNINSSMDEHNVSNSQNKNVDHNTNK